MNVITFVSAPAQFQNVHNDSHTSINVNVLEKGVGVGVDLVM